MEQFFSFVRICLTKGGISGPYSYAMVNDVYLFVLQRSNRARLHGSIDRRPRGLTIIEL